MKKALLIISLILFLSACASNSPKKVKVKINNKVIIAEVVEIIQDQARGLSGRESLKQDTGMLFVYDNKSTPTFWMKDMLFPIDIIWILDDKVVDISENLPIPDSDNIVRVKPKKAVNYVLEVNAGFVEESGIKVGDRVLLTNTD